MKPTQPRAFAYPLEVGADVPVQGRVRECANLIETCDRLLDVGCSSAWLAPLVTARGVQAYVGLDRAIAVSGRTVEAATFVEGSGLDLPFVDESFDAVCLFDVIEHLPRGLEGRAISEARRVLKRGGKLYFSTPHASPLHTPLDPVWALGHRHYRRGTVRRLLDSGGFKVERLFVAGGVVEGLDHIRLLIYKHVLHRTLPRARLVTRLIDSAHGRDRALGMTVFAVASRQPGLTGSTSTGSISRGSVP